MFPAKPLVRCVTAALAATGAGVAQAHLSPAYLAIGEGEVLVNLPPGGASMVEIMKVGPIAAPVPMSCVVSASWMWSGGIGTAPTVTIATQPGEYGPWVQTTQPTSNGFGDGSMTQAFNVPAKTSTSFYLNAADLVAGTGLTMQGTRISAICRRGAVVPPERELSLGDGPSN